MLVDDKIKTLYNTLKQGGANVGKDAEEFSNWFLQPGDTGYQRRHEVWQTLSDGGAQVGQNYEQFRDWLNLGSSPSQVNKPSREERIKAIVGLNDMVGKSKDYVNSAKKRVNDILKTTQKPLNRGSVDIVLGDDGAPQIGHNTNVRVKQGFNAQTGKAENQYTTESGNTYDSSAVANVEQNTIDDTERYKLDPVKAELEDAYAERDNLNALMAEIGKEEDKQNNSGWKGILRGLASSSNATGGVFNNEDTLKKRDLNPEYQKLHAAAIATDKRIKALEAVRDKTTKSLFKSTIASVTDPTKWDDGYSNAMEGIAKLDAINNNKNKTTEQQELSQRVLKSLFKNQQAEAIKQENMNAWGRFGDIAGSSVPFMKDFFLAGGAESFGKMGAEGMTNLLAKTGISGIKKTLLKNTGIGVSELFGANMMANVMQGGTTFDNIADRQLGQVQKGDDGTFNFTGGEGFMTSLYKGQLAQTFENYTEMLGAHMGGALLKKGATKVLDKVGLNAVSSFFAKVGSTPFYKEANNLLKMGGINGYFGEVGEEEANIILNSVFVGDNKLSDLVDRRTQEDIWGGMLFSVGAMHALPAGAGIGFYYNAKHGVTKADKIASTIFTPEKWGELKEKIDGTSNDKLTDVILDITSDDEFSTEEKKAALSYIKKATVLRGYNTASVANELNRGEEIHDPITENASQEYQRGQNAPDEQKADIKRRYDAAMQNVQGFADVNAIDDLVDNNKLNEISGNAELDDNQKNGIIEYINAKSAFDGMINAAKDNIDDEVAVNNTLIDTHTHADGNIRPVTLNAKDDTGLDKQAYLIGGNVAFNEDGTIDTENSNESVIIRHADTGELEMVSPKAIQSGGEVINAEEEKATSSEAIRQQKAQEQSNLIDDILPFNPNDTYTIIGEDGAQHQVQIIDADNTMAQVSIDGASPTVVNKADIQSSYEMTKRVASAETTPSEKNTEQPTDTRERDADNNLIYHKLPVEETIVDLYDGSLDDNEVNDFVRANIKEAEKNLKEITKRAPKITSNKAKYLADKQAWQQKLDEAKQIAEYWKAVEEEKQKITHTTQQELEAVQDELSGKNALEQLNGSAQSKEQFVEAFVRSAKFNPEDVMRESGMKAGDIRGMLAILRQDGMNIQEAAEELALKDEQENGGMYFGGDDTEARNAIIDGILSYGGNAKEKASTEEQRMIEDYIQELDVTFLDAYGLTFKEYLQYSEVELPELLRKYTTFDDILYINEHYEEIDNELTRLENENRRAYTTAENGSDANSTEVLQETQPNDGEGTGDSNEQGSEVETGLQGNNEHEPVSKETSRSDVEPFTPNAKKEGEGIFDFADRVVDETKRKEEEEKVETNPTEKQKEAGNYKKGHINVDGFDVTIEQPKGSVRRGTDANGEEWETTMHNTYGYIRGTEGVDGDHIDIFLSDDPTEGKVFVVDQTNEDGTFDEHKVMYGFVNEEEARKAYLSNYSDGWQGLGNITEVSKEDFKKWINSSKRKTKPFADYANVKTDHIPDATKMVDKSEKNAGFSIDKRFHKKNGTYIYAVNFTERVDKDAFKELKSRVKDFGGYYSSFGKGGFIFDSEEDAKKFADAVMDKSGESIEDAKPLSLHDVQKATGEVESNQVKEEKEDLFQKAERISKAHTTEEKPKNEGALGLVSDERMAELKERLRKKLGGQLNVGIDPEILAIGMELAAGHIDRGVKKFADFAKVMVDDLGDVIRPYLKAFYNGARDLPEITDNGLSVEMTSYDDVRTFDVANFDKETPNVIAKAEEITNEIVIDKQASTARNELTNNRNQNRRKENEQTTANTEAIASETEIVASKAESDIETSTEENQLNKIVATIDKQVETVNKQLALLGYYEADENSPFDESYGYMRSAEKKAVKDADTLAKRLVEELGIDPETIVDKKGKKRKNIAQANIAPAGGDVSIRLPLTAERDLYINISLEPDYESGSVHSDNLNIDHIYFRIENPEASGYNQYVGGNVWIGKDSTYQELIKNINSEITSLVPDFNPTNKSVSQSAKKTSKTDKSKKKVVTSQQTTDDLFGGLFDNINDNNIDNGQKEANRASQTVVSKQSDSRLGIDEARTDGGIRSSGTEQPVGERNSGNRTGGDGRGNEDGSRSDEETGRHESVRNQRDTKKRTSGEVRLSDGTEIQHGRTDRQSDEQSKTDGGREGVSKGESSTVTGSGTVSKKKASKPQPKFTNNYVYPEDASEIDNYTKSQRLAANVKALEVLRNLLRDGRQATDEEREILGRFRGWGGVELGRSYSTNMMRQERNSDIQALADIIDEFDPQGKKGILEAINRAALSSYYTPTPIAKGINRFLELAGYNGGNMLDPSMGNGIFEGTMPVGIQQRTAISGIELDWLTGQIAQHLYPDANVRINGFEAANVAPNSFDVVESNIPFGNFGVNDKDWKNDNTPVRKSAQARIHNYFAVKMIEATKAGGLCTIMTSNAILDTKGNQIIRDYIADQCEILGVVRLPDNTFKGAGTGVVTDVIFLRKYKDEADRNGTHSNGNYVEKIESPFLHTAETELINKSEGKSYKVSHNGYFASNPQMIIGEQEAGGQYRKDQYGLTSNLTTDEIGEKLNSIIEKDIVGKRKGKLFNTSKDTRETYQAVRESYTGDGNYVSNGNLVEQNGKYGILKAERGKYGDVTRTFTELPNLRSKADMINAMLPLRNAMKRLISEEINGSGNETLDAIRKELKEAYNGYVKKFGKLGEKDNDYLELDIDGFGIRALEKWKGGKYLGLSDIFTKNTIKPALDITQAKTPTDAISVCLSEYGEIRSDFMENVLGESWQEQCGDALFKVPFMPDTFETKDSYLSGDVKTKLNDAKKAAEQDDTYKDNVKALEEVQPKEIGFTDISIRMGVRWVPVDIYSDFLKEMFGIANWRDIKSGVAYSPEADVFTVNINSGELGGRSEEWKTERRSASEVFEAALKDKTLTVWDTVKDGNSETKVVNKEQTELVNGKIQDLRMAFEDWLPRDNERVQKLTSIYNDMFNRTVLRKFDGSHLNVPGLMGMELRPHQKDAVWMLINNRGGIVDHIVGAGKTLVMQSAIMEMRRMGIAKKPMIVALKSTVAQIAKEFKEAYPAARVLSPTEKDFQKTNRKKFLSNIALNDYDCVVLSHEQYCMLAHSEEVETQVINEQLAQLDNAIEFLYGQDDKSNLTKKQIKGLEKRKANLEAKLGKLLDRKVDREFTFENLGVDYLFVDECQAFKSLPYVTSYQNIAGLGDAKGSEKAVALLNGIRYLQKLHQGDMGTVFLSGTTITNSLVEIYNLMQYLRPREMGRLGLNTFDAWASQFAVRSSELEYGVTNELKEKNRFRNFDNVPELAKMYAEIADVRNDLNLNLPKPKPQMHIVTVPESDSLSEINSAVVGMVKNKDGSYFGLTTNERSPFGLLASTISAKAAISTKLIDPDLDDSEGKVKYVCENVKKIYDKFAKQKGTQLIFCDTGVPDKGKPYDAYTDIINRLVNEYGIPREEIVDIHVADTDVKRKALFAKVNEGKVRILIGGTKNMGTGVNVQKRITAMHHVDVPWTPADREQREGRGVRQGNEIARDFNGNNVDIFFYATEGSLDMYKYQLQDTKGKMFAQFKSGTVGERNFDEGNADESGGFDPAEIVALLSGNPVIFEKSKQDKLVEKLRRAKRAYESDWQRRKSKFDELTERKTKYDRLVQMNARDIEALERGGFAPDENGTYPSNVTISVVGNYGYESQKTFDKPKEAGAYIHKLLAQGKKVELSGFGMKAKIGVEEGEDGLFGKRTIDLDAPSGIKYSSALSEDDTAAGLAFRNVLNKVLTNKNTYERNLEDTIRQLDGADPKENVFPKQEELNKAVEEKKRLDEEYKKLSDEKDDNKSIEPTETPLQYRSVKTFADGEKLPVHYDGESYSVDGVSSTFKDKDALLDAFRNKYENYVATLSNSGKDITVEPWSKYLKGTVGNVGIGEHVDRKTRHAQAAVKSLANKLHLDKIEVITDTYNLTGKKKSSKGWYDTKTGKIVIILPNHTSVSDVIRTLLHEGVAHHGLRNMFGEHFDTFLDNVYANADFQIRKKITDMAAKNGWDFRTATEEYMASLAEDTNFENVGSWWGKIKNFFIKMLAKAGIKLRVPLSDNELRYVLWRSYQNLTHPNERSLFNKAEDIAMQYNLKVGEYAADDLGVVGKASDVGEDRNGNILYRDVDPIEKERVEARKKYNQRMSQSFVQVKEAMQDSMQSLLEAMEAIWHGSGKKGHIEDIPGFENPYLGENRLSSVNENEVRTMGHNLFAPLMEAVSKLAKDNDGYKDLVAYMMCKHGLERNLLMANKKGEQNFEAHKSKHPGTKMTLNDFIWKARKHDYSGITALMQEGEVKVAEQKAMSVVAEYETTHDTKNLWDKVNAVTNAILRKNQESGIISKEQYDNISKMYKYYIPLRGFDETTSSEAYAYINNKESAFNAPVKTARGRKSIADDPIAYLQNMAESVILQGNRNKLVKQPFLYFVQNHPSDLISISDLWLKYDDVSEDWVPVYPETIGENDSKEEFESKMADFETKMKALADAEPEKYKHGKEAVDIPYRVLGDTNLNQHRVVVKVDGRDYILTVNGNPRLAQAINGLTNPDNDISGSMGKIISLIGDVNRTLSAVYTTLQPDFIASNFVRDTLFSNTMVWVKESPKYAVSYNRTFASLNPAGMKILFAKYRKNELDLTNWKEKYFKEFMENGGETGYARLADVDQHKEKVKKTIQALNKAIPMHEVRKAMTEWIGEIGRGIESQARFAAFITSRNMRRTIERSIWDSKEISVNFNKKGAGDKFLGENGQTFIGNSAALVSGLGRAGYIFWNAAIQGTFGNAVKYGIRNPHKAIGTTAVMFALGMFVSSLGSAFGGGGDGDDNDYYNFTPLIRRYNLLMPILGSKSWIKLPLPIEYRAIYGMGELLGSTIFHGDELKVNDLLSQISQILPIDVMQGQQEDEFNIAKPFIPSVGKTASEIITNTGWNGLPIYKNTPFNQNYPEWTKSYKNANKEILGVTKELNAISGGNEYKKGTIDLNPAKIEYMLRGYGGGFWTLPDQLMKVGEVTLNKRDFDWRYFPLFNRVLANNDDQTTGRAINNTYFKLKEECEETKRLLNSYLKDTDLKKKDFSKEIDKLQNSTEYSHLEIYLEYRGMIDSYMSALKDITNENEKKLVEDDIYKAKKEFVQRIEDFDKEEKKQK